MGLHRNFMEKIDSDEGKVVNLPKKKKKSNKTSWSLAPDISSWV